MIVWRHNTRGLNENATECVTGAGGSKNLEIFVTQFMDDPKSFPNPGLYIY